MKQNKTVYIAYVLSCNMDKPYMILSQCYMSPVYIIKKN